MRFDRTLYAISCTVVASCAHYPSTAPTPVAALSGPSAHAGYRFENFPARGKNSDSIFVILTFSGGGTRAAALAYGVLLELARTQIDTGTHARSLLDEVDVISTISGGSFAGAYYALYGRDSLNTFETRFLDWNAESKLKRQLLTPTLFRLASPSFSRSDLAAETWDERLFHGATYARLVARGERPYLIINATDIALGAPFSFTQEQFDPLCDDLARFPIARAVAASSAFPGLLTPITIENHAGRCAFSRPQWALSALRDSHINADAYRAAKDYLSYSDSSARPYVHLMDGGPSDNLGVRPILRALESNARDLGVLGLQANARISRLIVIVVNARTSELSNIGKNPNPPGLFGVLMAAAGTPFDNYSNESLSRLEEISENRRLGRIEIYCYNEVLKRSPWRGRLRPLSLLPPIDIVNVTLDDVADPATRDSLLRVPTSFSLPSETVALIRDTARQLMRENTEFQTVLQALRYSTPSSSPQCYGV
jgi:NTE family protein